MLCISDSDTIYTVYVKDMAYTRRIDETCNTFKQSDTIGKTTVSIPCYKPLTGKYLEIVASRNKRLQVYEIQYFGKFYLGMRGFFLQLRSLITGIILCYLCCIAWFVDIFILTPLTHAFYKNCHVHYICQNERVNTIHMDPEQF
jgi:hypothetical protein